MSTGEVRVDLFGTQCNNDVEDSDGCVWSVENIAGWAAPDQRTRFDDITAAHGSFGTAFFASGRTLVVEGSVEAPSQTAAWAAYGRLTSSMPGITGSGDVVVYEPTPKALTVVQSGPPRADAPINGVFSFQLTLLAEYPWKRALTASTVDVTAGTFTHSGTFPAEFTFTTTSSGTVVLSAGGLTLSAASVPSGTVFDSLNHSVTGPGGEDLYGVIEFGAEWPAVDVGSNDWVSSGTADGELSFYPTYA